MALKFLGFSLTDIKTRLPAIDTTKEVSDALTQQAQGIKEKIAQLENVLTAVEKLNEEVLSSDNVNWFKYASIVSMLQNKCDSYWLVKHLGDDVYSYLEEYAHEHDGHAIMSLQKSLIRETAAAQKEGHSPESEKGQELAKRWWELVIKATGGDMSLVAKFIEMGVKLDDVEWKGNFCFDKEYIGKALAFYKRSIGYKSFEKTT